MKHSSAEYRDRRGGAVGDGDFTGEDAVARAVLGARPQQGRLRVLPLKCGVPPAQDDKLKMIINKYR